MQRKLGYPSFSVYQVYFGSWNNALEAANLPFNQYQNHWQDGTETCYKCGNYKKENQNWYTEGLSKNKVMCKDCYQKSCKDYMNNNLDINSATGFAFISQRIVAKTLGLELKHDCNCSIGFNHPFDLYDEGRYEKINVKGRKLHKNNAWAFDLSNKYIPDTYVFLGFSSIMNNIFYVWVINASDNLTSEKKSITITNTDKGLSRVKQFEVDSKPYNNVLHNMNLNKCSVLKSETEEEKRKHEEFKKTYFKKLGITE